MEIETDKTTVGVPSPAHGIIEEIFVADGDTVKSGQELFRMKVTGEAPKAAAPAAAAPAPKPAAAAPPPPPKAPEAPRPAVKSSNFVRIPFLMSLFRHQLHPQLPHVHHHHHLQNHRHQQQPFLLQRFVMLMPLTLQP